MVDGYIMEDWIVEDDYYDKSRHYGFDVPVGTWMVSIRSLLCRQSSRQANLHCTESGGRDANDAECSSARQTTNSRRESETHGSESNGKSEGESLRGSYRIEGQTNGNTIEGTSTRERPLKKMI